MSKYYLTFVCSREKHSLLDSSKVANVNCPRERLSLVQLPPVVPCKCPLHLFTFPLRYFFSCLVQNSRRYQNNPPPYNHIFMLLPMRAAHKRKGGGMSQRTEKTILSLLLGKLRGCFSSLFDFFLQSAGPSLHLSWITKRQDVNTS